MCQSVLMDLPRAVDRCMEYFRRVFDLCVFAPLRENRSLDLSPGRRHGLSHGGEKPHEWGSTELSLICVPRTRRQRRAY
jgi:hypothetical protein